MSDWPADGEIDIIENVNNARTNNAAIHATGECSVLNTVNQTGTWKSTDCNIAHDENQGCGTVFTEPANYGAEFNANGGGVYAMEWTPSSIKIWFFPSSSIPMSLLDGGTPDPSSFGMPSANFEGPCSSSFGEKFFNHSIVIDTTFCGGWAGSTFGTGSPSCLIEEGLNPVDSCVDYVANNPEAFKDAYWGIRSIHVWQKVQTYLLPGLTTPGLTFPTPAIAPAEVSTVLPNGAQDAILKPTTTLGSLNVSSLTGGVLLIGHDNTNADPGIEEYTEEDHSSLDGSGISLVSLIKPSDRIPFGSGNTEISKNVFLPESSLPPHKGKKYGNTGIVPSERLQSPVSSETMGIEAPTTLPLTHPTSGDKIHELDVKLDTPAPSGEMDATFVQTPKNSDHIIPADGDTGIVPPIVSNSPISLLWSSFKPELKGQLIIAGLKLPSLPSGSNPLSKLWTSLTLQQKNGILQAAKNLPTAPPETSMPTISDLINAASNGKIPDMPELQVPPAIQTTGNGLLGLLDAKTKAKLKAALGKLTKIPSTNNDLKRQIVSAIRPVAVGDAQAMPALLSSTLSNPQSQSVNPVLTLIPNVSVAALTNADTVQAMNGLLSFLDDSTKAQIAGLLLADDASTADVSQELQAAEGELKRRQWRPTHAGKTWNTHNQYRTWNQVKSELLDDTIIKLDHIIKDVASLDGPGPSQVTSNSILDVANPQAVEALRKAIDSININDRYKLAEFLTGNKEIFNQIGPLISLLLYNDGTTPATGLQDIMNAVNNYAASPNDDTLEVFMETLQDSTSALYEDISNSSQRTKRGGSLRAREATSIWTPQDKLALAQNVYTLCPNAALIGIPFPSSNDFAIDLLDPNKTLENATAIFQRKLQAYFDVTVQGCWTRINQWLAWRQLLRKPGTATILPFPALKTIRKIVRQDKNDVSTTSESDLQGFLEQHIYTVCPNPDTFSTAELIADLKDEGITINLAISKFQNKLWAYMAKLQSCSDKIRSYGPQLKALISSEDPIYHTTDNDVSKRRIRRQLPDLEGLSPVEILTLLDELKQTGQSYADLSPEDQKGIYDAMVNGFTQGQNVDPDTLSQLQNLALGLTQATVPLPPSLTGVGEGSNTGSQTPTMSSEPMPSGGGNGAQLPSGDGSTPPVDDNGEENQNDDDGGDDQNDDQANGNDTDNDNGGDNEGDDQDDTNEENQDDDNDGTDEGDDNDQDDNGEGSVNLGDDGEGSEEPGDDNEGNVEPGDDGEGGEEPGDNDEEGTDPGDNSEGSVDSGDNSEGSEEPGDNNEGSVEPGEDGEGNIETGDDGEGSVEPGDDVGKSVEPSGDDETSDSEAGPGSGGDGQNEPEGEGGDSGSIQGDAGSEDNGTSGDVDESGNIGDDSGADSGSGDNASVENRSGDGSSNDESIENDGQDDNSESGDSDSDADDSIKPPNDFTGGDVEGGNGSRFVIIPVSLVVC